MFKTEVCTIDGSLNLRTGSAGNRSADDMIGTLVEPKKSAILSIRKRLLERGYLEEVEYDAINVEPVLIYSKSDIKAIFLRHKWETSGQIPFHLVQDRFSNSEESVENRFLFTDEEGNRWLKFNLPEQEERALETLDSIS